MQITRLTIFVITAISLICAGSFAGEISKTFDSKKTIRIKTVSGDVTIIQGSKTEISVNLKWNFRSSGDYEPEFRERGNTLILTEEFHGSSSFSGNSNWVITVPPGTEIDFSTASGQLEVEDFEGFIEADLASGDVELYNCKGGFDIKTASGDIRADNCKGILELSTASGDVEVSDCEGEFDLSSASGNVEVARITVNKESSFTTASGDVEVSLAKTPSVDLTLSSASGDAELSYNGNKIIGSFEMEARYRKGHIRAPFDFETEDTYRRWGDKYVVKSVVRESDSPFISIHTASGRASLIE